LTSNFSDVKLIKQKRILNNMNIAVFCSGNGSNFQAIVDANKEGLFKADIALMVSDNPSAFAIKRAKKENVDIFVIDRSDFSSKRDFEKKIIEELIKYNIDIICLAGYMRLLSSDFVVKYRNKILNIHPALLPSFKGTSGIRDALDYGVKATGVTVHFVNEEMDAGPIILQESVVIEKNETEETLAKKIHEVEHRLYPEAIALVAEHRISVEGKIVRIV